MLPIVLWVPSSSVNKYVQARLLYTANTYTGTETPKARGLTLIGVLISLPGGEGLELWFVLWWKLAMVGLQSQSGATELQATVNFSCWSTVFAVLLIITTQIMHGMQGRSLGYSCFLLMFTALCLHTVKSENKQWTERKAGSIDTFPSPRSQFTIYLTITQEYSSWLMERAMSAATVQNDWHNTYLCFHLCGLNCGTHWSMGY